MTEQSPSAETEQWQNRDRQRLEQISLLQETVQSLQSASAEQSDFARCLRCVSHEFTRDVCGYAGCCVRQAIASAATPLSAVVDYTEQALTVARDAIDGVPDHLLPYRISSEEIAQAIAPHIADALSERDAAAIRAFGSRVWSDTEEVACSDEHAAMLARLQEQDMREAVIEALRKSRWPSIKILPPLDDLAPGIRKMYERDADAAIAVIKGMFK